MKYKIIAFDLDDTLNDGTIAWKASYEWLYSEWFKLFGTERSVFDNVFSEKRNELKAKSPDKYTMAIRSLHFSEVMHDLNIKIEWKVVQDLSERYWKEFLKNITPRDNVKEVIKTLKDRGYRLIIATDFSFDIQISKLIAIGVADLFSYVYTAEEVGSTKPTGDMFRYIFEHENIGPRDMIMIGDNMKPDIHTPKSLGIDTVLIKNAWAEYTEDDLKEPRHYINELQDLLGILE